MWIANTKFHWIPFFISIDESFRRTLFCVHFVCRTKKNKDFQKVGIQSAVLLRTCKYWNRREATCPSWQTGTRPLYSVLLHHPIKQPLNLVHRPLRGQSFPFPLLPLVFYIDKRHISINYSYNNSLSPILSFTFSPTHDVALEGGKSDLVQNPPVNDR